MRDIRHNLWQIAIVVVAVVVCRILYVNVYNHLLDNFAFQALDNLSLFFGNTWAIILTFGLDLLLIYQINKRVSYVDDSSKHLWIDLGVVCSVSLIGLLPLYLPTLLQNGFPPAYGWNILFTYLTLLLINLVVVSIFDLVLFFHQSRQLIQAEKEKKKQAQYQYGLLKQQLNPHFLFNSLNILDYIVNAGDSQHASAFIHKLASVYRYMLSMTEQEFVPLDEEKSFLEHYADLLGERFPQGLVVDINIPEAALKSSIIPLSLQVLLENATKHNVVHPATPLHITIRVEGDWLLFSNNLQPRLSASSTGVGLKNINQQYVTLTGQEIKIEKTDSEYTVWLPLI